MPFGPRAFRVLHFHLSADHGRGASVYYLTTTIDEAGMVDLINETANRINAPMRKRQPFGIVRTEEPLDAETMPGVAVSTFYVVLTGDVGAKRAGEFMSAMGAAVDEVRRMNEANYILARRPRQRPLAF